MVVDEGLTREIVTHPILRRATAEEKRGRAKVRRNSTSFPREGHTVLTVVAVSMMRLASVLSEYDAKYGGVHVLGVGLKRNLVFDMPSRGRVDCESAYGRRVEEPQGRDRFSPGR